MHQRGYDALLVQVDVRQLQLLEAFAIIGQGIDQLLGYIPIHGRVYIVDVQFF